MNNNNPGFLSNDQFENFLGSIDDWYDTLNKQNTDDSRTRMNPDEPTEMRIPPFLRITSNNNLIFRSITEDQLNSLGKFLRLSEEQKNIISNLMNGELSLNDDQKAELMGILSGFESNVETESNLRRERLSRQTAGIRKKRKSKKNKSNKRKSKKGKSKKRKSKKR